MLATTVSINHGAKEVQIRFHQVSKTALTLEEDKILDSKGRGVCCREMEDNKALPNPYLWILGGPHSDTGSGSIVASSSKESEDIRPSDVELNLAAPQTTTANPQVNDEKQNTNTDEDSGAVQTNYLKTVKSVNEPDTDSRWNTKRSRVSRPFFV